MQLRYTERKVGNRPARRAARNGSLRSALQLQHLAVPAFALLRTVRQSASHSAANAPQRRLPPAPARPAAPPLLTVSRVDAALFPEIAS